MLGYGDANTETNINVMFSAYMNEASATAAIVILSKLVSGVEYNPNLLRP
jgi:hypothetical protein